jgi:hypothetical protein
MKKFRTGVSKLFLIVFVMFGFNSSLLSATVNCEVNSENFILNSDEECIAMHVSFVVSQSLGETGMNLIEAETYGGLISGSIKIFLAEVVTKSCSQEIYLSIKKNIISFVEGKLFKEHIKKSFLKNKKFKNELRWLVTDLLVEIAIQSIYEVKGLEYKYKKSSEWMMKVFYNDFKAFLNPTVDAKVGAIIGNVAVLIDIGKENYNTMSEIISTRWDIQYNEAFFGINKLYLEYRSYFTKSTNRIQKQQFIDEFKQKCLNLYIDDDFLEWGYQDTYNSKVRFLITNSIVDIYSFDKNKLASLTWMVNNISSIKYDKYIESYFPLSEQVYLKKYYKVENFDLYYGILKSQIGFKQLKVALAYGLELNDFNIDASYFIPTKTVTKKQAFDILFDAGYAIQDVIEIQLLLDADQSVYSNIDLMTRREFTKLLVSIFDLESELPTQVNISKLKLQGALLNTSVGWFYEALILKKLGIAKGNGIGTENEFRPDDNINILELLVMLTNTMNVKSCGKVNCNVYNILEKN